MHQRGGPLRTFDEETPIESGMNRQNRLSAASGEKSTSCAQLREREVRHIRSGYPSVKAFALGLLEAPHISHSECKMYP